MSEEIVIQIPIRCSTYRFAINAIAWASIVGIETLGAVFIFLDLIDNGIKIDTFLHSINVGVAIVLWLILFLSGVTFVLSLIVAIIIGGDKLYKWISKFKFKCIPDEEKP